MAVVHGAANNSDINCLLSQVVNAPTVDGKPGPAHPPIEDALLSATLCQRTPKQLNAPVFSYLSNRELGYDGQWLGIGDSGAAP